MKHPEVITICEYGFAIYHRDALSYPQGISDAYIYSCSAHGLERVEYEQTEHYQVMRQFIVNPKRMLDMLLKPE